MGGDSLWLEIRASMPTWGELVVAPMASILQFARTMLSTCANLDVAAIVRLDRSQSHYGVLYSFVKTRMACEYACVHVRTG